MSALQADPEPPPRNGSLVIDESIVCGAGGLALSLPLWVGALGCRLGVGLLERQPRPDGLKPAGSWDASAPTSRGLKAPGLDTAFSDTTRHDSPVGLSNTRVRSRPDAGDRRAAGPLIFTFTMPRVLGRGIVSPLHTAGPRKRAARYCTACRLARWSTSLSTLPRRGAASGAV